MNHNASNSRSFPRSIRFAFATLVLTAWSTCGPDPGYCAATLAYTPAFGPATEATLKSPQRRLAELLDLDTGARATSATFGENDRETHAWIRTNKLDALGVVEKGQIAILCMDMAVVPAPSKHWSAVTASEVVTNWSLGQQEPNKITAISPATEKTDTFFFRTREGGQGVLQIVGQNSDPLGVRIRYKLVQPPEASDIRRQTASRAVATAQATKP